MNMGLTADWRIEPLSRARDADRVLDLFRRSADYLWLERGEAPTAAHVDEFFTGAPPGGDPEDALRLGLVLADGSLAGVAELAFGFPEPGDAFLGLLQLAENQRGRGLGAALLVQIEAEARLRGAPRLYVAVVQANPRGRAFWGREGFAVSGAGAQMVTGQKTHVATRMVKPL